uniref:Uncharacterized protein n=1 Tax=Wuchereria bancrofti TaxID=6293 RepID=A0AAF5PLC1_WUCBA
MDRRRDRPIDDGQENIAEMDIYRYENHIMTGPSLLLLAADAPSGDESLRDAGPEKDQDWGGVTGREASPLISPHFLFRFTRFEMALKLVFVGGKKEQNGQTKRQTNR